MSVGDECSDPGHSSVELTRLPDILNMGQKKSEHFKCFQILRRIRLRSLSFWIFRIKQIFRGKVYCLILKCKFGVPITLKKKGMFYLPNHDTLISLAFVVVMLKNLAVKII